MEYNNIQYDFPEISKNEKFILFDKLKSEETKTMNFDQYRKKVYNDLSTIETDIISNLAKHDKEFMEMFKNFEESDEILNKLESNLLFFKNKLSDINNDMKMLQNKSTEITIKLKNRKEFEEELFKLLDSIILAPEFLNDIICKDIDDEFINKINKLEEKLQTFTGGELPESSAINEIIPELRKTLAKVCSKIYSHILNTFLMLNKPGTNIQIIQKNVFLKMKQLVVFLKKHAPSMYTELLNKYVSLMEKIYLNSTNKYCQELIKLIFTKPEKFSLTLSEELNKDFFHLVDKRKQDTLKNIEKESIIPLYALTKKETYYNEQIFQSLNKFLMDLITWEVLFFNDFFDMGIQQSAVYLNNIYKTSVNLIFEFIQKNLINKNADYFSISLMIIVDYEQQKIMEDLKLNHLDYYFFELLKLLWVKFDQIFKSINEQIFKSNNKNPRLLNNGIHTVTHKVGELLSMINLISKNTTNTPMILVKIKEIQIEFNKFFSTLAETMKYNNNNDREELITYLNLIINKYFEEMNKLLQKCISKNDKSSNIQPQNEINFIDEEVNKLNKNDLKNIAQYFNSKYRDILNNVKKNIYNNITDNENAKITYTKFLNELLNKYAAFTDLLRYSKNEDILMNIVSVQKLMIEINNIMKGM